MIEDVSGKAIAVEEEKSITLQVRVRPGLYKALQDYVEVRQIPMAVAARAAMTAGVMTLEAELASSLELSNKRLVGQKLEISVKRLHGKAARMEELLGELRDLPANRAIANEIAKLLEDV